MLVEIGLEVVTKTTEQRATFNVELNQQEHQIRTDTTINAKKGKRINIETKGGDRANLRRIQKQKLKQLARQGGINTLVLKFGCGGKKNPNPRLP